MQSLKILERLALAILPALAVVAALSLLLVLEHRDEIGRADRLIARTDTSRAIAALVHEMQRERGASVGHLAAKGEKPEARDLLAAQRRRTDAALDVYRGVRAANRAPAGASDRVEAALIAADERIAALPATRAEVDALKIAPAAAIAWYSGSIVAFFTSTTEVMKSVEEGSVTTGLLTLQALMAVKEQAGQERATGNGLVSAGSNVAPCRVRERMYSSSLTRATPNRNALNVASLPRNASRRRHTTSKVACVRSSQAASATLLKKNRYTLA